LLMLGILLAMGNLRVAADPPKGGHHHDAEDTVAHPHDPVLQAEHTDMLSLVPRAAATHTAVGDGRWSDPATCKEGQRATADADVLIPTGKTVTVDEVLSVPLRTVRVDGKLEFAPDRDTGLVVDTMVVPPGGELIVGTVQAPVARDRRARIIFADRGP